MKGERLDLVPTVLQSLVDAFVSVARDGARRGKEIPMVAAIGDADTGEHVVIPYGQGTPNEGARLVRKTAQLMDANFILLVSEAWQKTATKADGEDFASMRERYKEVRHMPGRRDVVMFQLETRAGLWTGSTDIPPHKGRTPRYFEDPVFSHGGIGTGRLVGLLPVPDAPKH